MTERFKDDADWSGVTFASTDVGAAGRRKQYIHEGYRYSTQGECRLAALLDAIDVPFTPDVRLLLELADGRERTYVPDFVFNGRPYLWRANGKAAVIHGIEVKGKCGGKGLAPRALENTVLLYRQRHIRILILSDAQISAYLERPTVRRGSPPPRFPLHRLDLLEAKE